MADLQTEVGVVEKYLTKRFNFLHTLKEDKREKESQPGRLWLMRSWLTSREIERR